MYDFSGFFVHLFWGFLSTPKPLVVNKYIRANINGHFYFYFIIFFKQVFYKAISSCYEALYMIHFQCLCPVLGVIVLCEI